jgi:vacuolar-type H+-ATPase subunit I/STV1
MKRHQKYYCKQQNNTLQGTNNEDILEKIKNMEKEITNLKKSINTVSSNTTNNNTTNNTNSNNNINNGTIIQNNIVQINPFGKEQIDITDKQLIKFLRKCCNSVPELINFKHFNKDMPENSNVYISNVKATHAKIFTGDKWEIRDANDIVHQLYEDNNDYLMDQFEDKKGELDEMTVRKFNTYVNRVEEEKTVKHVKKSIKQGLYNNKHIPMSINKSKPNLSVIS